VSDLPDDRMRGVIHLDVFNLQVAVFDNEDARLAALKDQGCNDLTRHTDAAIASAHMDATESGSPRLSMVIKPHATKATWAHECVHIADFVMDHLQLPTGVENTEIRAYLVGHLFAGLQDIFRKKGKAK
jgi:hypothetical protein